MEITEKEILKFFTDSAKKSSKKTWHLQDIQTHFNLENRTELRALLSSMVDSGKLERSRRRTYGLPYKKAKENYLVGTLQVTSQGYGFLLSEEPGRRDTMIPEEDLGGAVDGDKVVVRPKTGHGRSRGRPRGEVVDVVERKLDVIIGTLDYKKGYALLRPDDSKIREHFKLDPTTIGELEAGTRIAAKIMWPEDQESPKKSGKASTKKSSKKSQKAEAYGQVVESFGKAGEDPEAEIRAVIIKFALADYFEPQVLEEAEAMPKEVKASAIRGRLDMRELNTFTIDGSDAKDFDDALSIERSGRGKSTRYKVGIHIADVSHYVQEGSYIDQEAKARATSVYLPGSVLPMLPESLSNGICSLVEGEDRLTFSVIAELDSDAQLQGFEIKEAVINSNARLTYEQVQDFFDGGRLPDGKKKLEKDVKTLQELSQKLRAERFNEGALDFDFPETRVDVAEDGTLTVFPITSSSSRHLIEEFMLLANRLVAKYMQDKKIPALYRVHEDPSDNKLQELQKTLQKLGYKTQLTVESLQEVIAEAKGKPEAQLINMLMLRSLKQARYSPENLGHFGLAFENYLHFTSPIRRYPDLIVHRVLRAHLKKKLTKKEHARLSYEVEQLAPHTSELERNAEDAERDLKDYFEALWAKEHLGEVFDGTITGVMSYGIFIAHPNGIEGLLHISELKGDQYFYVEDSMMIVGKASNTKYRLGQHVKVQFAAANPLSRQIDLALGETALGQTTLAETALKETKQAENKQTKSKNKKASKKKDKDASPQAAYVKAHTTKKAEDTLKKAEEALEQTGVGAEDVFQEVVPLVPPQVDDIFQEFSLSEFDDLIEQEIEEIVLDNDNDEIDEILEAELLEAKSLEAKEVTDSKTQVDEEVQQEVQEIFEAFIDKVESDVEDLQIQKSDSTRQLVKKKKKRVLVFGKYRQS